MKLDRIEKFNSEITGFEAIGAWSTGPNLQFLCPLGHEFSANKYTIKRGKGKCPVCANAAARAEHERYVAALEAMESPMRPLHRYVNPQTKILHICEGEKIYARPDRVLKGLK